MYGILTNDLVSTEVLGTPSGNKELFKSGIKLGSSRGLGSVEKSVRVKRFNNFELRVTLYQILQLTNFITNNESVDKTQQYEQRPDCGIWCKTEQLIHDIITEK